MDAGQVLVMESGRYRVTLARDMPSTGSRILFTQGRETPGLRGGAASDSACHCQRSV